MERVGYPEFLVCAKCELERSRFPSEHAPRKANPAVRPFLLSPKFKAKLATTSRKRWRYVTSGL